MSDFKDTILQFIAKEQLFDANDTILLGISGGVDSVVLAHLLHQIKQPIVLAHVNFQLRGEASDGDESFVKGLAKELQVPLEVTHFPTSEIAQKESGSIQMIARDLRYNWFRSLIDQGVATKIAIAHHLNDSLETALLNLTRSTGLKGLSGIDSKYENIIRPFLGVTKQAILDFAESEGIKWREDASNQSVKYKRNLMRHEVVPRLQRLNPSLLQGFQQTSQMLQGADAIVKQSIKIFKNAVMEKIEGGFLFSIEKIEADDAGHFKLNEVLRTFGFNFDQVQQIISTFHNDGGKVFLSEEYRLWKDRGQLILMPQKEEYQENYTVQIESGHTMAEGGFGKLCLEIKDPSEVVFTRDHQKVYFDFDQVEFPLSVRKWRQGDVMRPFGMRGKKKISDILIDQKVPLHKKTSVYVVVDEAETIIWAIGLKASEKGKITNRTQRVIEMKWLPN